MKVVLIVDPVCSAEYVSQVFKSNNIYSVALFTCKLEEVPVYSKPSSDLFNTQIFISQKNIDEAVNVLADYVFDFIVNGDEHSTVFTDKLSEKIKSKYSNDSNTSDLRMNKFDMLERVKSLTNSNFNQVKVFSNTDEDSLQSILNIFNFPVFCKPVLGHSSAGAFRANTILEIISYFNQLNIVVEYLVQEFLVGDEFFADVLSIDGKHYISCVVKYKKDNYNGFPIYRMAEVVSDEKLWNYISIYVLNVLNILDVKNGFTHSEVMVNKTGDEYHINLIELNNRNSGAVGTALRSMDLCHIPSQPVMLCNYLNTGEIRSNSILDKVGYSRTVYLHKFSNGIGVIIHLI